MAEKMKHERRSPLKNLPVRQPGQSIREQIIDLLFDQWLIYWTVAIMFGAAALMLWQAFLFGSVRITANICTIIAGVSLVLALTRGRSALRQVGDLKLGRTGEEAVGQYLEETLRPLGAQVLHDIPMKGFNIDHVVIHASGIYTIETKTHSKPAAGKSEVTYDGAQVTVNGFTPDRDPVVQAKAEAAALHELLKSSTGKRFKVQPVVLYPGWWVSSSVQWPDVWVQNEKQFPPTLEHQNPCLPDPDVHLATDHLKRYVIAESNRR
jgi:hypothetical protein